MNNTLLKGLAVLELLSHADRPLSLTQIAAELGIVKSNVHRLMQALVETRFVLRDETSGTYAPSIKLWELGSGALGKLDLRRHAEAHMETLLDRTGESVHLSVLDRAEVVYVHKVDSLNPVRAYTQIGGRAPAYCVATGKAQLAFSGTARLEQVAQDLKPFTERTICDPELFLQEMARIRQKRVALNRGEWRDRVHGIAAPIMDARGSVIAAVGISGPAERFKRAVLPGWSELVAEAGWAISHALGGGTLQSVSRAAQPF
jgi:IclR family transcriptional regulator, KDG regulon repressor